MAGQTVYCLALDEDTTEATPGRDTLEGTDETYVFVFETDDAGFFSKDQIDGFSAGDFLDLTAFGFTGFAEGRNFPLQDGIVQIIDYGPSVGLFGTVDDNDFFVRINGANIADVTDGLLF